MSEKVPRFSHGPKYCRKMCKNIAQVQYANGKKKEETRFENIFCLFITNSLTMTRRPLKKWTIILLLNKKLALLLIRFLCQCHMQFVFLWTLLFLFYLTYFVCYLCQITAHKLFTDGTNKSAQKLRQAAIQQKITNHIFQTITKCLISIFLD